jgi:hypothetical protein
MNGTAPAGRVEPTIAALVNMAAARLGASTLAKRARVGLEVVVDARYRAGLWHGPGLLRVLAEAERALQEEPR